MIPCQDFYNFLQRHDIDFFSGVPDSLLKSFCAYVSDHASPSQHIIAANEGAAVALGIGHHLSTKKIPLIYMQNSGLGNAVNPLLSLADSRVYQIPLLLLIGWRGEPTIKDEPQHKAQGEVMLDMLSSMNINYTILSPDFDVSARSLTEVIAALKQQQSIHALIVRKNTFSPYVLQNGSSCSLALTREEAVKVLIDQFDEKCAIIATTGMLSRELFECRAVLSQNHCQDFLTVGGMGHASQIALSVAMHKPDKSVYCLDGDGAALMHLGSLAIAGQRAGSNFKHILINNGAHQSVGGQPTVGFDIDFCDLAKSLGYQYVARATSHQEIIDALRAMQGKLGFLEIQVNQSCRTDLGRPTITPVQSKELFMAFLN
ncbi:MAG: phosphonopyruvate decarboxylase [Gammaproteobacteria bacterium]